MPHPILIEPHVCSVIDDEGAVLLDLKQGTYFGLNEVGVEIWLKLKDGFAASEIESYLQDIYDVPLERLREDVSIFIDALQQRRLIDVGNGA